MARNSMKKKTTRIVFFPLINKAIALPVQLIVLAVQLANTGGANTSFSEKKKTTQKKMVTCGTVPCCPAIEKPVHLYF